MGCVIIYRHNSVFNYCKFLKPVKFLCITYFIILWPHMPQEIYWNFSSREEVIVFIESLFNYIWCQYINLRELLTNADSDLKIELIRKFDSVRNYNTEIVTNGGWLSISLLYHLRTCCNGFLERQNPDAQEQGRNGHRELEAGLIRWFWWRQKSKLCPVRLHYRQR